MDSKRRTLCDPSLARTSSAPKLLRSFPPQLIVPTGKHLRPYVAFGKANIELSCSAESPTAEPSDRSAAGPNRDITHFMRPKFGQNKFRARINQVFSQSIDCPMGGASIFKCNFGKANIELSCAAESPTRSEPQRPTSTRTRDAL